MSVLYIIGIGQALFFCLFLLTKKENKLSNIILSFWLFVVCYSLLLNYLYATERIEQFPHLIGTDTAFPFLYMPLLYFYSKLLVARKKRLNAIDILHLTPFVFYLVYVWVYFYSESGDYKLEFLQRINDAELPLDIQISNIFKIVQAVVYITLIFGIIHQHQRRVKLNFSYTERISLLWLKTIIICLSVIYTFKFLGVISIYFDPESYLTKMGWISDLVVIIFIYLIALFGIKQPDIFARWENDPGEGESGIADNNSDNVQSFEVVSNSKYLGSNLSSEEAQIILFELQKYMEAEKPFLESQLSIKDVAQALDVNTKKLSQVINEQFGLNFFNYINEYRVNEVKARIIAPEYEHLSVLGIALDCGFNSKSSFNSVFKRLTGKTPTDYKSETS